MVQSHYFGKWDKLTRQDIDIINRGINPALGLLLPDTADMSGFPIKESDWETISSASSLLHQLGRSVTLELSANMIKHGMLEGKVEDKNIILKMSERVHTDHFMDQLDLYKLQILEDKLHPERDLSLDDSAWLTIKERMAALTFPFDTGRGVVVGYHADPDIDELFILRVMDPVDRWADEAGIHPAVAVGNFSGADLRAVMLYLSSIRLKHVYFVHEGMKNIKSANYTMSLTTWTPIAELQSNISQWSGIDERKIGSILEFIIASNVNNEYYYSQTTPDVPLLVRLGKEYVLMPVSFIFKNPFHGLRMRIESAFSKNIDLIRERRESWMRSDLYNLFQGDRYQLVEGGVILRDSGRTVTDIDAAIFDNVTGSLALFQLKWQDFNMNDVRSLRSKAKNFVEGVNKWIGDVAAWLEKFEKEILSKTLRIKLFPEQKISNVYFFSIGRFAARFKSYGYTLDAGVASCSWSQFIRLRYEVGPAADVFEELFRQVKIDADAPVEAMALRHEIACGETRVVFEDLWVGVSDGSDPKDEETESR